MKKIIALLLTSMLLLTTFSACTNEPKESVSERNKTAYIHYGMGSGYGVQWLKDTIAVFNELYKEKGYKVVLEEEGNAAVYYNKIMIPKKNLRGDIFMGGGYVYADKIIQQSRSVLGHEDYTLLEDLTDLYDQAPIGLNGEEDISIKDKLLEGQEEEFVYIGETKKWQGKYFTLPYSACVYGFVYNTEVLNKFGYSTPPKTTDELYKLMDEMMLTAEATSIYPVSWAGGNANTYWIHAWNTFWAQYSGIDKVKDFYGVNVEGDYKSTGYEIFSDEGLYYANKVISNLMNLDYAADRTIKMIHTQAQDLLIKGKAAFMANGDWLYNEAYENYTQEQMNNIIFDKGPLVSDLGVQLKLDGTGLNRIECDSILSQIVGLVDKEELSDAEIALQINKQSVTAEKVGIIRERRNYFFTSSHENPLVIPSYAAGKEVAKLFVRFMYSDDGMEIRRKSNNTFLPAKYYNESKMENLNNYQQTLFKASAKKDSIGVTWYFGSQHQLFKSGLLTYYAGYQTLSDMLTYFATGDRNKDIAKIAFDANYTKAKENWASYISQLGV